MNDPEVSRVLQEANPTLGVPEANVNTLPAASGVQTQRLFHVQTQTPPASHPLHGGMTVNAEKQLFLSEHDNGIPALLLAATPKRIPAGAGMMN